MNLDSRILESLPALSPDEMLGLYSHIVWAMGERLARLHYHANSEYYDGILNDVPMRFIKNDCYTDVNADSFYLRCIDNEVLSVLRHRYELIKTDVLTVKQGKFSNLDKAFLWTQDLAVFSTSAMINYLHREQRIISIDDKLQKASEYALMVFNEKIKHNNKKEWQFDVFNENENNCFQKNHLTPLYKVFIDIGFGKYSSKSLFDVVDKERSSAVMIKNPFSSRYGFDSCIYLPKNYSSSLYGDWDYNLLQLLFPTMGDTPLLNVYLSWLLDILRDKEIEMHTYLINELAYAILQIDRKFYPVETLFLSDDVQYKQFVASELTTDVMKFYNVPFVNNHQQKSIVKALDDEDIVGDSNHMVIMDNLIANEQSTHNLIQGS